MLAQWITEGRARLVSGLQWDNRTVENANAGRFPCIFTNPPLGTLQRVVSFHRAGTRRHNIIAPRYARYAIAKRPLEAQRPRLALAVAGRITQLSDVSDRIVDETCP